MMGVYTNIESHVIFLHVLDFLCTLNLIYFFNQRVLLKELNYFNNICYLGIIYINEVINTNKLLVSKV